MKGEKVVGIVSRLGCLFVHTAYMPGLDFEKKGAKIVVVALERDVNSKIMLLEAHITCAMYSVEGAY